MLWPDDPVDVEPVAVEDGRRADVGLDRLHVVVPALGHPVGPTEAEGVEESGYRLLFNTGPDSGQEVFHAHLHVLGGRRL